MHAPVCQRQRRSVEHLAGVRQQENEPELEFQRSDLADEEFVGVRAIHVGGVEEGDAGGDGVVDELDHVGLRLGWAVEGGHAQATKALRGYLQPLRTQLDAGHGEGGGSHERRAGCSAGYSRLVVGFECRPGLLCGLVKSGDRELYGPVWTVV
jgi:hypothetical protein